MEVNKQSTVGDLGAGGGHILASLDIKKRIAVEVNGLARLAMEKIYPGKINAYEYPEDVPDNTLDLLFSTSAIEHFECPLTELREMAKKVKVGGRIVSFSFSFSNLSMSNWMLVKFLTKLEISAAGD